MTTACRRWLLAPIALQMVAPGNGGRPWAPRRDGVAVYRAVVDDQSTGRCFYFTLFIVSHLRAIEEGGRHVPVHGDVVRRPRLPNVRLPTALRAPIASSVGSCLYPSPRARRCALLDVRRW